MHRRSSLLHTTLEAIIIDELVLTSARAGLLVIRDTIDPGPQGTDRLTDTIELLNTAKATDADPRPKRGTTTQPSHPTATPSATHYDGNPLEARKPSSTPRADHVVGDLRANSEVDVDVAVAVDGPTGTKVETADETETSIFATDTETREAESATATETRETGANSGRDGRRLAARDRRRETSGNENERV